jgi:hypothetical protein
MLINEIILVMTYEKIYKHEEYMLRTAIELESFAITVVVDLDQFVSKHVRNGVDILKRIMIIHKI